MIDKIPAALMKINPPENKAEILVYLEGYNNTEIEFEITIPYDLVKEFSFGESIMLHLGSDKKIKKVVKRDGRCRTEIKNWPQLLKTRAEIDEILKSIDTKIK